MKKPLSSSSHILFIGDSITDCGRDRALSDSLGEGYVAIVAAYLNDAYPGINISNRGIGGDRIADLASRWKKDCLDLHPTHISILIGINDTWRFFDSHEKTEIDCFEKHFRTLLDSLKSMADVILCEPFLVPQNNDQKLWHLDLDPKRRMVRGLANEYRATFVSIHEELKAVASETELIMLTNDGVHPTAAGHAIIADLWCRTVGVPCTFFA